MSSFGDGERGEAEAEKLAEMQAMHLPMKKWFASDDAPAQYKEVSALARTGENRGAANSGGCRRGARPYEER